MSPSSSNEEQTPRWKVAAVVSFFMAVAIVMVIVYVHPPATQLTA